MFKIEHSGYEKLDFRRKKQTFGAGDIQLALETSTMFRRITYRELTLLFGIVVACIIILTLWLRQPLNSFINASGIKTGNVKRFGG